jgi:hypothetical protein
MSAGPTGGSSQVTTDELGPVFDFQKHKHQSPHSAIYMFTFGTAGYINRVDFPIDAFNFDDQGRLIRWQGSKLNWVY